MQGVDGRNIGVELRRLARASSVRLTSEDMEVARSMSGLFWFIGGGVTAVLLPLDPPTETIGAAGTVLAVAGVLICFWIGLRHFDQRVSLLRIYIAGFAGVGMVVALEYLAGGRDSPYHYLYMLPILFAAAAQSPRRVCAFAACVAVVIWAPLLYDEASRAVALDIATQLVTLSAIGGAVWALFVVLRLQRRVIREQRARAEMLARQDALTGLGNRRAFSEALTREVARARRHDERLSVLVGDLDHFKEINDHEGHAAGDEHLRRAADALRSTAREADACFRWGGDEFAVLLPSTTRGEAEIVARRLESAISGPPPSNGSPALTITCGVAELGPEADPEALIASADRDLLARKRG